MLNAGREAAPGRPLLGRHLRLSRPNQVIVVLCLMYLVLYVDRVNIATAAPHIMADLSLSNAEFGFAVSAFAFPYAAIQLCGGWLTDRFGSGKTLIGCGLLVCAATMLTGLVGGLTALVALRLVLGFGEGFAFPAATRAIADRLPASRWGHGQGITHAASRLGNALTPPLVVALIAMTNWRGAFVLLGLASLLWVTLWVLVSRADPTASPSEEPSRPPMAWLRLLRRIAPLTMVDFCYGWTLWVFLTWLPTFFLKSFGLDLKHSALFSSGVLLAGVAGDIVGGLGSDYILRRTGNLRAARCNLIIVGMLGAFLFLLPVVLTHDLAIVAISLSLACFFAELVVAPIWAAPMDIAPDHAATASGMMNFGFGLAGILSPLFFGAALDATNAWTIPFGASIALLPLGAALSFFIRPDRKFKP